MSNIAKYSCTALAGTNKAGKLKADEHGYREMVLGAYDFDNSAGAVYPFESAQALFKRSIMFDCNLSLPDLSLLDASNSI